MTAKITRIPIDSSMISAIGYVKKEKTLYAEFVNTGYIYAYYDVSEEEFADLQKAKSVESYFRDNILDFYTGLRVSEGEILSGKSPCS